VNTKISKYYDKKQAEEYETRRGKTQAWHVESEVFNEIKNRIATKYNNNMDVLDVGAGTGRWMLDLNDVASKYVVTDISENMLVYAKERLNYCSEEFKKNTQIIASSVEQLPLHVNGKFDLIIMTRFLSFFSITEIKNIMKIIRNYTKGDVVISLRVTDKKKNILSEALNLIIKSPIGAIKRYQKSGKLSYAGLDSEYHNAILESGFCVKKKNVVVKEKYNRYEYWELTLDQKNN